MRVSVVLAFALWQNGAMNKLGILKEFWDFLKERKKWWLVPVIVVLLLLGSVLFLSSGSVVAPFIYTIF